MSFWKIITERLFTKQPVCVIYTKILNATFFVIISKTFLSLPVKKRRRKKGQSFLYPLETFIQTKRFSKYKQTERFIFQIRDLLRFTFVIVPIGLKYKI